MSLPESERVNPQEGICNFYLARKNRFCKTEKAPGSSFCPTHLMETSDSTRKRVPCPINPNHTIYADDVKRHVLVCPDRRFDTTVLPYFSRNLHAFRGLPVAAATVEREKACETVEHSNQHGEQALRESHRDLDSAALADLISKVNQFYTKYVQAEIVVRHVSEENAKKILCVCDGEESSQKHAPQHAALLSLVYSAWPTTSGRIAVLEMGAGKGGLALAMHQSMASAPLLKRDSADTKTAQFGPSNASFFVVDVGGFRRKKDGRVRDEENPFSRLRINIKDLDLGKVAELKKLSEDQDDESASIVGVGKHLCGACTDFALSCLTHETAHLQIAVIVVATCCHHLCQIQHINSILWKCEDALADDRGTFLGMFSKRETAAIASMSSWAVSGSAVDEEKRAVGRRCKRIFDFARIMFLREKGFSAVELTEYVHEDVSPENVCIFARR